jgi:hypothetical protein
MFEKIKSANSILKKISNVALLTFEGAAFNVTFLALLLILVYPLTMVLKQQRCIKIYLYPISLKTKRQHFYNDI